MSKKPIKYEEIEEEQIVVLRDNQSVNLLFLDNGYVEDYTLKSGKEVNRYVYNVNDLDDLEAGNKEFSTLSKKLVKELGKHMPLMEKKLKISKIRTGVNAWDFDIKIKPIE